jgi:alkylation response protein AidB-like acyl-CoA dehydrogenase
MLNDEERLIVESAARFADAGGGVGRARRVRDALVPFDRAAWERMAALGWFGICVPPEHGGLGLGARAACLLLETVGRRLVPEPLVATIAAGYLLSRLGPGAADDVQALLQGSVSGAPVPVADLSPSPLRLQSVPDWCEHTLLLLGGMDGTVFRVRAMAADAQGIAADCRPCVDGSVLADVECGASAAFRTLADGDGGRLAFETALDLMRLGYSAYLVGLMDGALAVTLDYMKVRRQFGAPIGTFQALQHRAASCYVDIASTRALLLEVCQAFTGEQRPWASAAVKARASAAALRVCKECVQFHGAIGFADEHDIGLYLRRAMSIAGRLGGEIVNRRRCAAIRAGDAG